MGRIEGHGIYEIGMQTGVEGELEQYPTPDEMWTRTFATRNARRDRFAAIPFEDWGGYFQSRYYQDIAIERVLAAIADGKGRILLTLAKRPCECEKEPFPKKFAIPEGVIGNPDGKPWIPDRRIRG